MESLGNVMEIIKGIRGTIPERGDLPGLDLVTIKENSTDRYDCVANGFYIGWYLRGLEEKRNALQMSDDLYEISLMLDKALAVAGILTSEYFGSRKEVHEKNRGSELIHNYDEARLFSCIESDYMYNAREFLESIIEKLNQDVEREQKADNSERGTEE